MNNWCLFSCSLCLAYYNSYTADMMRESKLTNFQQRQLDKAMKGTNFPLLYSDVNH